MISRTRIFIEDASLVGEARRAASSLAADIGLSETDQGRVALIVTEAANNVFHHAERGEILLRSLPDELGGLEILAIDHGPGIRDVARCLEDGYSTGGTAGTGFAAIQRNADVFDLYSLPGKGTVVLAQCLSPGRRLPDPISVGVVCVPKLGEEACGDCVHMMHGNGRSRFTVFDGLGHGAGAADAAAQAVRVAAMHPDDGPAALADRMNRDIAGTRGGVVGIAEVSHGARTITYAGIGNIQGEVTSDTGSVKFVSHNGTVGNRARPAATFQYPWPEDGVLVMTSDGLQTHWRLDDYPGLRTRHPSVTAGVLFRDHLRVRDDASVLVAQWGDAKRW